MINKLVVFSMFTIFLMAPSAVFATSSGVMSGILEMGDISDSNKGIEVSLSPSVSAVYIDDTPGSLPVSQWYAIGAGHPGGTKVYATAQNITNIWTKGISNATELTAVLGQIPNSKQSESLWSTNGWDK